MEKKEKEKIKQKLLERKLEILKKLDDEYKVYIENIKPAEGDMVDEANTEVERELSYNLSAKEKQELMEINYVLKKIDDGTYGICEDCGAKIPIERLKIKPFAKYCIKCEEKKEREEKKAMRHRARVEYEFDYEEGESDLESENENEK